jgi:hypothetical protein
MCCAHDETGITARAEWLVELSERARARGNTERADRLLLLAWQAYDGQEISLERVNEDETHDQPRDGAGQSARVRKISSAEIGAVAPASTEEASVVPPAKTFVSKS